MSGPAAPQASSRRAKVIAYLFLVVFGGGLLTMGYFLWKADPSRAVAGSCVKHDGGDQVSVVGCDNPDAEFKVLGRVEDRTQVQASISACGDYEGTEQTYWESSDGDTGYVLCLAKNP
jgi:hypothetical protein